MNTVAKLRKNESNAKEKTVFYVALLSDSNFGVAKVTKSRVQYKTNRLFLLLRRSNFAMSVAKFLQKASDASVECVPTILTSYL